MKKRFRQLTACLLLVAMVCLQGCAGKGDEPAASDGPEEKTEAPKTEGEASGSSEHSMGRYLEEEVTLPEEMSVSSYPKMCLKRLDSGELILLEQSAGMYASSDNGASWSAKDASWLRELRDAYIAHMTIAPDGSVALVYSPKSEEGEETGGGYHPVCLYVDPEGNPTPLESPDGSNVVHQLWFGKDSRLYAYSMSGKIYEMDPADGSAKQLFEMEGLSDYVCFTDSYMIISGSRGLTFYDMKNEMVAENDKVLQDFLTENVSDDVGANADCYTIVLEESEQPDVIYFACENGLYRHVIGGTAVEQIMEGSLSSLGDPKMSLAGIAVLPDNEFMLLYTNGKLYRYIYHPEIPTIPEEQISIYSLTENYAIRQAVSLYQKQHPEAFVRYEIGLNTGSGMTSEDAIKNLNTRLMSGSGPDLLVLDGLPRYSYEEKGILTELSELAGSLSGEDAPFPNLVEACREDGKLWYLPLRFRLPILLGDQEAIGKVTDLTSLADVVEDLRTANPEGLLLGLATEDKALRTLGINCSGTWTNPKTGAIDKEKLTEFLTQAKRIYQAEIQGISEEDQEEYTVHYASSLNWSGAMEYFAHASNSGLNVAMGEQKIGVGITHMVDGDFNMVTTLANQEENFGYQTWQGQIQNGFIPKGMIGICSGSKDSELVQDFFRFLYGRELQDIEVSTGLPVNMASFEHLKENPRPENQGISIGSSGPDGIGFSLEIKWTQEADFQVLKDMTESASAVCAGDTVIEEVVYEIGQKALNGSVSVEAAVEEIVKKAAIYLAE